jgi:hypothetical protein
MKARELAASRKDGCCKIAIALIDPCEGVLTARMAASATSTIARARRGEAPTEE